MAIHIKDFNIGSFKGIKDLSLKDLNHINIITGNNNTGKTSILELLYTINDPNRIGCWFFSNHLDSRSNKERFFDYYNNLFPADENDSSIYYEYYDYLDRAHKVNVDREIKTELVSEDTLPDTNKSSRDDYTPSDYSDGERFIENKTLYFKISRDLNAPTIHEINSIQPGLDFFVPKKVDLAVNYISPVDHSKAFELDDILRDNELHEEMIAILREFDDSIIDVVSVGNGSLSYMIRSKKHSKVLPLNFYGDGMRKALLMLSSMLGSKNGILLLDEFETAIHTSAMDHIFSWLLNSAIKLNVQVFLTSHSKEAINKVLRCDESISDKISYYTLFSYEGKNLVRRLSCSEAIKLQDQGGMDIRWVRVFFLLDAISDNDPYDKVLIEKCREFVSDSDPEERYLKHRSYRTKAEFSSYFCIRTPADAYQERNSLMKQGIKWIEYPLIREEFNKLGDL